MSDFSINDTVAPAPTPSSVPDMLNIDTKSVFNSLQNVRQAVERANKSGLFELKESHQLYEDVRLISKIVIEYNNMNTKLAQEAQATESTGSSN